MTFHFFVGKSYTISLPSVAPRLRYVFGKMEWSICVATYLDLSAGEKMLVMHVSKLRRSIMPMLVPIVESVSSGPGSRISIAVLSEL